MDEGFVSQEKRRVFWVNEIGESSRGGRSLTKSKPLLPTAKTSVTSLRDFTHGSCVPQVEECHAIPRKQALELTSPSLEVHHASPLAQMRDGDSEALDAFFDTDRIQDITLDVHRYLARMYPEPCWEDEPFEFLHGYI